MLLRFWHDSELQRAPRPRADRCASPARAGLRRARGRGSRRRARRGGTPRPRTADRGKIKSLASITARTARKYVQNCSKRTVVALDTLEQPKKSDKNFIALNSMGMRLQLHFNLTNLSVLHTWMHTAPTMFPSNRHQPNASPWGCRSRTVAAGPQVDVPGA